MIGKYIVNLDSIHNINNIITKLHEDGLLIIDAVNTIEELLSIAQSLGSIIQHRDADERGLTHIMQRDVLDDKSSTRGFTAKELLPHTDGSSVAVPPTLIIVLCKKKAQMGGLSTFVDSKVVFDELSGQYSSVLKRLLTPKSAIFGSIESGICGSIFNILPDGNVYVRFRYDERGYYSPHVVEVIPKLLELIEANTLFTQIEENQAYIVQNGRWLHGRTEFVGEREMIRILVKISPETNGSRKLMFGFTPRQSL